MYTRKNLYTYNFPHAAYFAHYCIHFNFIISFLNYFTKYHYADYRGDLSNPKKRYLSLWENRTDHRNNFPIILPLHA